MSLLVNLKAVINLWDLMGILLPIYWNASVVGVVTAFVFHGFEENRQKHSEKWSWVKKEVVGILCGDMFGKEKVPNSVFSFPGFGRFSVGQI